MSPRDLRVRGGGRHAELGLAEGAGAQQPFAQPRVLAHRETMVRGQRKDENVAIE